MILLTRSQKSYILWRDVIITTYILFKAKKYDAWTLVLTWQKCDSSWWLNNEIKMSPLAPHMNMNDLGWY